MGRAGVDSKEEERVGILLREEEGVGILLRETDVDRVLQNFVLTLCASALLFIFRKKGVVPFV